MGRLAGKAGEVTVGGATVTGIKSWKVDYKVASLDSTGFDDVGVSQFKAGVSGWTGSFDGHKDGAPLTPGTEVALVLKESQTGTQKWNGQAIIDSIGASNAHDGLTGYAYTFTGTGALTVPTT
jgi:hypothetical protein